MSHDMRTIDITPAQRKTILELLKIHIPHTQVWAYGSRVKWTSKPTSDLDLVVFAGNKQRLAISNLKEAFEDSNLPFQVDLFIWNEVPETFRRNIEAEHVVLQEEKNRIVASDWRNMILGDVLTLQRGFDLPKTKREPGPYHVIASTGPVGTHIETKVNGPGVVIGRSGSLGGGQYIEDDFWPLNTTLWVKDFKGNDRRFCYYLLKSLDFSPFNTGSGVPTLNRNHIHPLPVCIPYNLNVQRTIAHILGTLDDKIELNRRMNETLEAMAQALFKSWFVDFDPVIDNAIKAGNPIPESLAEKAKRRKEALAKAKSKGLNPGLPPDIAGLFPDSFVETDNGVIPKGWEVSDWGKFIVLQYGKRLKNYKQSTGLYPVFGTNGQIGWHTQFLCKNPGIIIGRKGAYRGIHFSSRPFFVIDTAFYVEIKKALELRWAYYMMSRINLNSMDSGSAIPSTSRESFYALQVVFPPYETQHLFIDILDSHWKKKEHNRIETNTITLIKDALLPKLLSGELRVKDSARFLEDIV